MDQSYVYTDAEREIVKGGVGEISKVLFGEDSNAKRRLLFYLDWYLDPYYQNDLSELYEPIKEMLQDVVMNDNEDDIKEEALHLLDVYIEPPFDIFKENINAVPKHFLLEVIDLIQQEETINVKMSELKKTHG